ncbi:hypothetical protein [Haloferula sp.]|uniref:hypothetical protein n=1 Tax=Haloferula sp. TaxID=2497595 RepID=UPI003C706EBE
MRRLLFIPLALLFSGCGNTTSQSDILARAKAEVSKRENWSEQAYIRVDNRPSPDYIFWRDLTWEVSAGAFDYSGYPKYNGINVLPGTERELRFTRDGCLIEYKNSLHRCADGYNATEKTVVYAPEK